MRRALFTSALVLSLSLGTACLSFAQPFEQQDQFRNHKFREVKKERLRIIHEKIHRLEQEKACIEYAQDFQALKNCQLQR